MRPSTTSTPRLRRNADKTNPAAARREVARLCSTLLARVRRKTGTARAQTAAMYRSKTKINKLATKRHLQMSQRIKPAGHLDMSQQDRLWDPSDLICARFSPRRE